MMSLYKYDNDSGYASTANASKCDEHYASLNEDSFVKKLNFLATDHDIPRRGPATCTSTPYSEVGFEKATYQFNTPATRKRKKWIPHSDSSFDYDHINDPYTSLNETPNRTSLLKQTCTRKLWPDITDGSISDPDGECDSKKICLEGTRSEPNSPPHYNSPNSKLGSIERLAVLYPNLRYRDGRRIKYNLSTPKKIRQRVREQLLNITPKINPNQELIKKIHGAAKVDFFTLFTKKSLHWNIIEQILMELPPKDLQSVYNVSKTSRSCVVNIPHLNRLRKGYLRHIFFNKENVSACKRNDSISSENLSISIGSLNLSNIKNNKRKFENKSKVVSPTKREWLKFVEASAGLEPGQKLTRCSRCSNPAKMVTDLVICLRKSCEFIRCMKCCDQNCASVIHYEAFKDTSEVPTSHCSALKNKLTECTNSYAMSNLKGAASMAYQPPLANISNKNGFSNSFKMDIPAPINDAKPKSLNDLIEMKAHSLKVKTRLFYTPDSPPKISKPVAISSEISKKNLRRLL